MTGPGLPFADMLDTFCPMHVVISKTGHICHVGPTLRKLRPHLAWEGTRFLEVFRLLRPREVVDMDGLVGLLGRKLTLELRDTPRTTLKGLSVIDSNTGTITINLSFGISVADAVRDYALSNADFAATDLTIELLYLLEAQGAAMDASRNLNARLQGAKSAAEKQAFSDALTGLSNRRAFEALLSRKVAGHAPLTLLHLDLDFFKEVNDTLGHAAGDFVLEKVAEVLRGCVRQGDMVARMGGDEFMLLLPQIPDPENIAAMGRRIIAQLEAPLSFGDHPIRISGSIGAVNWDGALPTSPETLMNDSDIALYASKHAGRGQITLYSPKLREDAQSAEDLKTQDVELWT